MIGAEEVSNPDDLRIPVSLVVKPIYLEEEESPKKTDQQEKVNYYGKKDELDGILKRKKTSCNLKSSN